MTYIEVPTIGEILTDEFLEPFKLSQNVLARAIFVPPNRIHQIVKGTRSITVDTDLRLCKLFGMSDGYFLRLQEGIEIRKTKRQIANEIANIKTLKGA